VIDQTEDCYHLNLSQDSGLESPDGSYAAAEITSAINEFPEKYRVPFSMHVAGYKYNEIAEEMNLPLGTIRAASSSPARSFRSVSPTTADTGATPQPDGTNETNNARERITTTCSLLSPASPLLSSLLSPRPSPPSREPKFKQEISHRMQSLKVKKID
jgi:hypothetical protein